MRLEIRRTEKVHICLHLLYQKTYRLAWKFETLETGILISNILKGL